MSSIHGTYVHLEFSMSMFLDLLIWGLADLGASKFRKISLVDSRSWWNPTNLARSLLVCQPQMLGHELGGLSLSSNHLSFHSNQLQQSPLVVRTN